MGTNNINDFVDLSVILTGFSKNIIAPSLDPKNIKQIYFDVFAAFPIAVKGGVEKLDFLTPLLNEYNKLKSEGLQPDEIGKQLINTDNGTTSFPSIALISQSLIYLWYLGIIPGIQQTETGFGYNKFGTITAGSEAYTTGLVWNAMQAHAMGYSNYSYGYWSKVPADLKFYTGEEQ